MSFPAPEYRLADLTQPTNAARRRTRWLLPAALVVLLLLAGGGYAGWRYTHRADPQVTACRDAVTAQLKAPATARWPGESRTVDHDANGAAYTVLTGAVDAQNGFGSLVRTRFECVFNPDGSLRRANLQD